MFNVQVMGLGKKIREVRLAKGWTLEKLEQASGVAVGTISALEKRDSARSMYFPSLARALGIPLTELYAQDTEGQLPVSWTEGGKIYRAIRTLDGATHIVEVPEEDLPAGHKASEPAPAYGMAPIFAWEHEDELPPGEYVMVPRLDVHLSAGNGKDQVEIDLSRQSPQAFRAEWIRERKFKPKRLAAMTASGNSMEPAIHHGDSLLVDTSQTEVVDGRVYALWYEGGERVKRLFRLPGGGLRIKSDNPEHGAIELGPEYTGHVRVIGRVVHRSGTGGL
jgi:phage repressor protein C with HTH and peptisase S24 domain/DNA-binding XRE family transcriptional regulator